MDTISFKQFKKDFANFYNVKKGDYIRIESEQDMDEVIWEIYDKENTQYEINYENNTIELY